MTHSKDRNRDGLNRRDFLARGAAAGAALPLFASPLAAAAAGRPAAGENFTVIINLEGGNDLVNTTVPVQVQPYFDQRPGMHIRPQDALSITGGPVGTSEFKLHPELSTLKTLYESGELAFIQRVGYPDPNLSHFESMDIWSRGWRHTPPSSRPGSGWIARYRDTLQDPMSVVGLGVGNRLDFAGGANAPVALYRLSSFRLDTDWRHSANGKHRIEMARRLLANGQQHSGHARTVATTGSMTMDLVGQIKDALDSYSSSVTYPNGLLGERLKDAAVLLQAGFPTRLIYTALAGFDTHADQGTLIGRHPKLLDQVDSSLGAFVADLKAMGMWDQALIVVISEFGRRNEQNGSGTDHGEGGQVFCTGGRVRGGFYGAPIDEAAVLSKNLPYEIDFRSIYKEVLSDHLGTNADALFPERLVKNTKVGFLG